MANDGLTRAVLLAATVLMLQPATQAIAGQPPPVQRDAAQRVTSEPAPAVPARKPIQATVDSESLTLTNDVAVAEAQARAYPDDPEAQFLLAMAYSRTPYLEKSFAAFKKAKKLIKTSPGGYADFDAKIAEYERMLAYKPDDPLVLYRLGFGYFVRGYGVQEGYIKNSEQPAASYYAKAEETFHHLLAVRPDDIWALNYLGFLLVDQDEAHNLDKATALWERSVTINPVNPGAYLLLAEASLKRGNLKKAMEYGALAARHRIGWQLGNVAP